MRQKFQELELFYKANFQRLADSWKFEEEVLVSVGVTE